MSSIKVHVISADPSDESGGPTLYVADEPVPARDILRSELLQEIAQLEGETELCINQEGFQLWQKFQTWSPGADAELASVLTVRCPVLLYLSNIPCMAVFNTPLHDVSIGEYV